MSSAYLCRVCPILMGVMLFTEENAVAEVSTDQVSSRGTSAEFVKFDMDMLKGRNIDPEAARHFAKAPRFPEGSHTVSWYVNGMSKGQATAFFDREGQLVLTTDLLDIAHLANPGRSEKILKEINAKFLEAYPMTQVELKPGKSEVGLIVLNSPRFPRHLASSLGCRQHHVVLRDRLLLAVLCPSRLTAFGRKQPVTKDSSRPKAAFGEVVNYGRERALCS